MRKSSILITILFLTIGFATISTTFLIRGNTSIGINQDDFNVYFSDVKVNGVQDLRVVTSERELTFSTTMKSKNETYVLDYDVTNGSKNYDAMLEMTCTGGNDYLLVNNVFDTNNNLLASETRSGKLIITLEKQYTGESLETEVKCTIIATGVERIELDTGIPTEPLEPILKWIYTDSDGSADISKGDEIILASNENEKFNVISQTDDSVTMLAKYNLDATYYQSQASNYVRFSNSGGWEYKPGPMEIDIKTWSTNPKTYVNEYVTYLKTKTGDATITGNLITMAELGVLECTISVDYSSASDLTCANSSNASWLLNGQSWWTRSAYAGGSSRVWFVNASGGLSNGYYGNTVHGVRPVITIPKNTLYNPYKVGNEITIANERFNVISSTEDDVTLLAKYNLGTDYKQSITENSVSFSNSSGWEYAPGPKEIDIQLYDGNVKTYVNEYVSFLKQVTGDNAIAGNLITLVELGTLGCTYPADYTFISDESLRTCANSQHKEWLLNNQYWWTRSARTDYGTHVWRVHFLGAFAYAHYSNPINVRPVITISKETYDRYYTG